MIIKIFSCYPYFISSFKRYDWMEIHDGPDETAPLIGRRLCGPQKPAPITSTGNTLFVRFDTDFSIVSTGYKIRADLGRLNLSCSRVTFKENL